VHACNKTDTERKREKERERERKGERGRLSLSLSLSLSLPLSLSLSLSSTIKHACTRAKRRIQREREGGREENTTKQYFAHKGMSIPFQNHELTPINALSPLKYSFFAHKDCQGRRSISREKEYYSVSLYHGRKSISKKKRVLLFFLIIRKKEYDEERHSFVRTKECRSL